jgi:hypothetical protein
MVSWYRWILIDFVLQRLFNREQQARAEQRRTARQNQFKAEQKSRTAELEVLISLLISSSQWLSKKLIIWFVEIAGSRWWK